MSEQTYVYVGKSPITLNLPGGKVPIRPKNTISGPEKHLRGFSDLIPLEQYEKRQTHEQQRREQIIQQRREQQEQREQNQQNEFEKNTELPPWVKRRREKEMEEQAEQIEKQVSEELSQQEQIKTVDDLEGVEKELCEQGIWDPNTKAVNIDNVENWRKVTHEQMEFILDEFSFPYSEDDTRWDKKSYIESIFAGQQPETEEDE